MSALKWLEKALKNLGGLIAAIVLYCPWRAWKAQARLANPRNILVVRLDNRVGEALLSTALLDSLRALPNHPNVDVLVHPKTERVLKKHPSIRQLLTLDKKQFWQTLRAVRQSNYDVILNATDWVDPSISATIVSRLLAHRSVLVGFKRGIPALLHDVNVQPLPNTEHEASQRCHLGSVLPGHVLQPALSFRDLAPDPQFEAYVRDTLLSPYALFNPGSRLSYRRVPLSVFVAAAKKLHSRGLQAVVMWGPGEATLADEFVRECPFARKAPATDIDGLAHFIQNAAVVVTNNTGPMHLSISLKRPTLGLFYRMPEKRWGNALAPNVMLNLTPFVENGNFDAATQEVLRLLEKWPDIS